MPVPLACGALTNKARLASLQFVLLLMSPAYLQSKACIREMVRACAELSEPSRILPIVIEKYDLETAFGSSGYHTGMLNATIGNILPPPDQGVFEDDFDGNMIKLIERIRSVGLYGDAPARSKAYFEDLVCHNSQLPYPARSPTVHAVDGCKCGRLD